MAANTQSSKALRALRGLILSGELAAGERLYEVSLSEDLGISRTPLRDALSRLEQEGLVERVRSGGFAVRTFSYDDVMDAIELRGVLEGTAARLAAERGASAEGLDRMRTIVAKLDDVVSVGARALDFESYAEFNGEFHACLAGLSGSSIVEREITRSSNLPFASPSAFLEAQSQILAIRESLITAQQHHRDILEAIELRQGSRAEAVAREHARQARKNLEYMLRHDRDLMEKVPGLALVAG